MQRTIFFIAVVIILFFFFSCSVRQDMTISLEGSGEAELSVTLKPVFVLYILDLAEAMSDEEFSEDMDIFEIKEIKKEIRKRPGISTMEVASPTQEKLRVKLTFSDVVNLFSIKTDKKVQKIISFTSKQGMKTLHFHLDKHNYSMIAELFPMLNNPVFENLAPQPDENITEPEYLDIIEFAMGEEGRSAVINNSIKVTVTVKGTIVSQKGGEVKDGVVYYKIPLKDVLLLNDPLDYEIVFK